MIDTNSRDEFLKELDSKIQSEWRWEKLNRIFYETINYILWGTRFLLLALSIYQIKILKNAFLKSWVVFSIAFLAMLNITLPQLSIEQRFQQRQEVFDRNAREYTAIKMELLAGKITLDIAVDRFNKIYKQPTEAVIRRTL